MSLPHGFKRITLHLARSHEFPDGSPRHGYDILAPLTADGRIDLNEWRAHPEACRVERFWAGEPIRVGRLMHRAGGPGGATWIFDYDGVYEEDDEAGYRLGDHSLLPGEYVSVRDEDGDLHTFRVARVENVA